MNHHSSVESALDDIKTGEVLLPRDEPIGNLFTGWVMSGIEMARVRFGLLCGTAGTCDWDVKGDGQEKPSQGRSTEAQRRGGRTRNACLAARVSGGLKSRSARGHGSISNKWG